MAAKRMRLQFLPVNSAWVSFFGDAPCSIRGENYFHTLDAARSALRCAGLKLVRQSASQYTIVIKHGQEDQNATV